MLIQTLLLFNISTFRATYMVLSSPGISFFYLRSVENTSVLALVKKHTILLNEEPVLAGLLTL